MHNPVSFTGWPVPCLVNQPLSVISDKKLDRVRDIMWHYLHSLAKKCSKHEEYTNGSHSERVTEKFAWQFWLWNLMFGLHLHIKQRKIIMKTESRTKISSSKGKCYFSAAFTGFVTKVRRLSVTISQTWLRTNPATWLDFTWKNVNEFAPEAFAYI